MGRHWEDRAIARSLAWLLSELREGGAGVPPPTLGPRISARGEPLPPPRLSADPGSKGRWGLWITQALVGRGKIPAAAPIPCKDQG